VRRSRLFRSACTSIAAATAVVALARPLVGQATCAVLHTAPASTQAWATPLDRTISIRTTELTLREALQTVAARAGVRLSYSSETVANDRVVCFDVDGAPLGDVLRELLDEQVDFIAAAQDHIVLAPRAPAPTQATPSDQEVIALERIVVTGTATEPGPEIPYAFAVVGRPAIERLGSDDLPSILSGSVPGLWAWSSPPTDLRVRYGSVRGASSFGATYPKVYVDGIEVANPLVLAQLTPEAVERIEVIRGPQGAALYGSDAVSGVINIVTRHDPVTGRAPSLQFRTGAGVIDSDFSPSSVLSQDHVLTMRAGAFDRSVRLNVATGSTGEFVPEARSRYYSADASGRVMGLDRIITGTARLNVARAGSGLSPLLEGASIGKLPISTTASDPATKSSSIQYTLGTNISLLPDRAWSHLIVLGLDGYRLSDTRPLVAPAGLARASAVAGDTGGDRLSVRTRSQLEIASGRVDAAVNVGLEHSILRESVVAQEPQISPWSYRSGGTIVRKSGGAFAQVTTSVDDALFLVAGLRVEASDDLGGSWTLHSLPMLGATAVGTWGSVNGKLRAAYGKGLRPASTALRESYGSGFDATGLSLPHEEQSGVEAGVDLIVDERLALSVTRFEQLATNLVQVVPALANREADDPVAATVIRSSGAISNRGWEAEARASLGRLALSGSFSAVDSRVRRVAEGYAGDLNPGGRMLAVPARTASAAVTWTTDRWSASLNAYRAWDWINYDQERLLRHEVQLSSSPSAGNLRDYWRSYDGVPRLSAMANVRLRQGLTALLSAENLFNQQIGEPDNLTVVPGRTLSIGLRAQF